MSSDDAALLERWRHGDMAAGEELIGRHFQSVYLFFANKTGGPTDDLIQETFAACVEGKHRIREGASFRSYLLGVARHQLYASYRERGRVETFDPSRASIQQLVSSPSVLIARHQNERILLAALRAIPLESQLILELTYWEQMTGPEAAEVLGVPPSAFKSRLRRAREALGERFEEMSAKHGITDVTLDDLERWAHSLREELAVRRGRAPT